MISNPDFQPWEKAPEVPLTHRQMLYAEASKGPVTAAEVGRVYGLSTKQVYSMATLAWSLVKKGELARAGRQGREVLYSALSSSPPPPPRRITERSVIHHRHRTDWVAPKRVDASPEEPPPQQEDGPSALEAWLPEGAPVPVERGAYVLPSYAQFCQAMRGYRDGHV